MYKRVMRVMMVGLLAMLGAKAEAHYIVVGGRCYWHSGECTRKDKDVQDPVPILFPPIGEVVVTPKEVEILCSDGIVHKPDLASEELALSTRNPIVQSNITRVITAGSKTSRNAEWSGIVSDAHFLEDPTSTFCGKSGPPVEAIVRTMAVKINLYCSPITDTKCFSKPNEPHSTWQAEKCTLPAAFDVKNLPARGTRYDCSGISICHGKECPIP